MAHSKKNLKQALCYISEVRDALRMQNWDVTLHLEPMEDPDCNAETWWHENHYSINIRLGQDFFDAPDQVKRGTIIHELVHANHRDVGVLWDQCTINNSDIAESEAKAWNGDFRMFMERFVSWITMQLALRPDLPQWPGSYTTPSIGCHLLGDHRS